MQPALARARNHSPFYTVEVIRDVLLAGIGSVDIKQEVSKR